MVRDGYPSNGEPPACGRFELTDKLHEALDKHFTRHRIVFWYDPDGKNRETAESYTGNGIDLVDVENNQFAVKHRLLRAQPDTPALVYAPSHRSPDDQNWLLDIELSHFVFSTNQAAWIVDELGVDRDLEELIERHLTFFDNKRDRLEPLRVILEKRMEKPDEEIIRLSMISVIVSDTKAERYTSKDLSGILLKLFQDVTASEDDRRGYEDEIERYELTESLWNQIRAEFGFDGSAHTVDNLLAHLFRHALQYEMGTADGPATRRAYTFLDSWRNNIYYATAFTTLAERFGKELNVRDALRGLPLEALLAMDLFKEVDRQIVRRLINQAASATVSANDGHPQVMDRRSSYWVSRDPGGKIRLYYDCLKEFFQFQITTNELCELGSASVDIWRLYADKLHKVDGQYRRFLELHEQINDPAVLEPLLSSFEARYVNGFLQSLSEAWGDGLDSLANLPRHEIPRQADFFDQVIKPYLTDDRIVFVVMSDALRYEVGAELSHLLEAENRVQVSIEACLAAVPTYTQLGMTALLPHGSLSIDSESLLVSNDGKTVQGTAGRDSVLREYFSAQGTGKKARALGSKEFAEMTVAQQEEEIQGYDCVYLYSSHIDAVGDNAKTEQALPGAVRTEINFLRSLVKRIMNLNRTHVVITADHGFLYQYGAIEESDMVQISSVPGILHKDRRFILGSGLSEDSRFLAVSSEEAGLEGDSDIYLVKGLSRIRKQGGGTRFVHGGASIQELCIPVIRVRKSRENDVQSVHFVMLSKATDITTNQVALEFFQANPVGPKTQPRRITARFESANGDEVISNQRELNLESEDPKDQNRKTTLDFVFTPGSSHYSGKLVYLTFYEDRYGQAVQVEDRIGFRFRTVLTPDF
jgi:uncharacterized protein (TIGR02687 family)